MTHYRLTCERHLENHKRLFFTAHHHDLCNNTFRPIRGHPTSPFHLGAEHQNFATSRWGIIREILNPSRTFRVRTEYNSIFGTAYEPTDLFHRLIPYLANGTFAKVSTSSPQSPKISCSRPRKAFLMNLSGTQITCIPALRALSTPKTASSKTRHSSGEIGSVPPGNDLLIVSSARR
jgi:hypothetical protein